MFTFRVTTEYSEIGDAASLPAEINYYLLFLTCQSPHVFLHKGSFQPRSALWRRVVLYGTVRYQRFSGAISIFTLHGVTPRRPRLQKLPPWKLQNSHKNQFVFFLVKTLTYFTDRDVAPSIHGIYINHILCFD